MLVLTFTRCHLKSTKLTKLWTETLQMCFLWSSECPNQVKACVWWCGRSIIGPEPSEMKGGKGAIGPNTYFSDQLTCGGNSNRLANLSWLPLILSNSFPAVPVRSAGPNKTTCHVWRHHSITSHSWVQTLPSKKPRKEPPLNFLYYM